MRIAPHLNHDKWGVRLKLLAVALVVFAVWDLGPGLCFFRGLIAPFLGSSPVVGATGGTVWEW